MRRMSDNKIRNEFALLPKIINGGIAGIIGVSCVFPLDLVKTRLQNQQIGPNGEKMYKNMIDCFKKIYSAEGYFGMYRGSSVSILLITPEKAIKLAANDYFRHKLTNNDGKLPIFNQMVAGGLAGAFQIIVTTPMELLKIQMQDAGRVAAQAKLAGKSVDKVSATKLVCQLFREKGIFGLYKGIGATALRDVTFSIIYFPLFAFLNALGPHKQNDTNESVFWWSFLSGLGAGSFSAFIVTPFDVIKTQLQTLNKSESKMEIDRFGDYVVRIIKHEGPAAFFKGGLCRVIVIAPLFGIAQMVYFLGVGEIILKYFDN